MSATQSIRAYLIAHPDSPVMEISEALGMPHNQVAARLCNLRDSGHAVSEEAGRSLSNRPILRWKAVTPPPSAPKPVRTKREYVSSQPKREESIMSLDALIDSMAEGLVAALVSKVKAKLPAALAGAAPAAHLTLPAPTPAPVAQNVVLPPPAAPAAYTPNKPIIGVVGLLPQQAGALQAKFGGSLDIRFWNDGDDKGRLRAIAEGSEAVFLHTRHAGHHTDQLLKTYSANLRRVTGGTSTMEVAIRAYFINKETAK